MIWTFVVVAIGLPVAVALIRAADKQDKDFDWKTHDKENPLWWLDDWP